MIPILLLLGLFCLNDCLHAQTPSNAGTPETNSAALDSLLKQYHPLAKYFLDKTSWGGSQAADITEAEKLQFKQLSALTKEIVDAPGSQEVVFKLLEGVQDHDGYTRQALFSALLHRSYVRSDYPFLRKLFLYCLNCKEAGYPNLLRGWQQPGFMRFALAIRISTLTNPLKFGSASDQASMQLLNSNPKAWIDQQHP